MKDFLLLEAPAFLISLDRQPTRYASASERVSAAGYVDVRRWAAVDGKQENALESGLAAEWAVHGSPKFDPRDTWFADLSLGHTHKQGTVLSHLNLLKHIIDNAIPLANVFEDDIVFHKDFATLAPAYYGATPKDYDMLYIGHHCGYGAPYHILSVPVYCTHAYVITLAGAKILYNRMINDPVGMRAIDCQINDFMVQAYMNKVPFLKWYVWNAEFFPDPTASKHPNSGHKDMGLVFQECLE